MVARDFRSVWFPGCGPKGLGEDVTCVRDETGRTWLRGPDGHFHDATDNRHHLTDQELRARHTLYRIPLDGWPGN